jgi:hypothetical protein
MPQQADTERVLGAVDELRNELVETVSEAVRIESVNPKYPGQVELFAGEVAPLLSARPR